MKHGFTGGLPLGARALAIDVLVAGLLKRLILVTSLPPLVAAITLLYIDLRVRNEGLDVEALATTTPLAPVLERTPAPISAGPSSDVPPESTTALTSPE